LGAAITSFDARADEYPSQLIKVIIPNPPGGPGDVITRVFADKAASSVGKQFVFEYRAGASTTIGAQAVNTAAPDGYTILGFPSSGLAVTLLRRKLPYNLDTDFQPIIGLGNVPLALIVRANLGFKSVSDFEVALKKGGLFYGSGGLGTIGHLTGALMASRVKGSATHIPYKGNPDVLQGMMGGNCDFTFSSVADAAAQVGSTLLQVLAVTSDKRFPGLPDVPTMAESGYPEIDAKLWYAFLAPAKVPANRIRKLYEGFATVAKDPAVQAQLANLGFSSRPLMVTPSNAPCRPKPSDGVR
jgi:tripartite-type tricarboxylate transporter receptor subunit TctC